MEYHISSFIFPRLNKTLYIESGNWSRQRDFFFFRIFDVIVAIPQAIKGFKKEEKGRAYLLAVLRYFYNVVSVFSLVHSCLRETAFFTSFSSSARSFSFFIVLVFDTDRLTLTFSPIFSQTIARSLPRLSAILSNCNRGILTILQPLPISNTFPPYFPSRSQILFNEEYVLTPGKIVEVNAQSIN